MLSNNKKKFLALVLSALLVVGPTLAYADTESDLNAQVAAAEAKLNELALEASSVGEEVNEAKYQEQVAKDAVSACESDIEAKQQEYDKDTDILGARISAQYKSGGINALSVILGTSSFEDFINNLYYMNRICEQDNALIDKVVAEKKDLEAKKVELTKQHEEAKKQKEVAESKEAELKKKVSEQQAYKDNLDAKLKAEIKRKHDAELARQKEEARRAEETRKKAEEQNNQSQNNSGGNSSHQGGSVAGNTVVNIGCKLLGLRYVYGGSSPVTGLDCSGFTQYCYRQVGIHLPHSARAQASCGRPISRSQLQPGDLMIWLGGMSGASGNHVAMYAGNGLVIHENGRCCALESISGWSNQPSVFRRIL